MLIDVDGLGDRDLFLARDLANLMSHDVAVGVGQREVWGRLARGLGAELLERAQTRADELAELSRHGLPGWHEAVERVRNPALEDPLSDSGGAA